MKIPIVNEEDEIIKIINADDRKPGEITRITGIWVGNEKGEVLLAKRAFSKKRDPGKWGPAAAGSVEEGETYESNALKELEEEIGLKNVKLVKGPKFRRSRSPEYFAQLFMTIVSSDYPLVKQDAEVEDIKWFSKEELQKLLKEKPELFLPSVQGTADYFFNYMDQNKELINAHQN